MLMKLTKNSCEKCARKTLMKLTTAVNFINIFRAHFSYKSAFCCQNISTEEHFPQKYINKIERTIDISTMRSVVNSCFVSFVLPSSGHILAIYYTLYGLCKIKPLDDRTYVTKNQLIFGFTPLLLSRHL